MSQYFFYVKIMFICFYKLDVVFTVFLKVVNHNAYNYFVQSFFVDRLHHLTLRATETTKFPHYLHSFVKDFYQIFHFRKLSVRS